MTFSDRSSVEAAVGSALDSAEITDTHTHLFPPAFGGLFPAGIDELLTHR